MNIIIRKASEADLPEIIGIYAQPSMDNNEVISIDQAKIIFKKMHCSKLVLSSNLKRKNAHQFYKSLGFKQHGISFYI